MLTEAFTLVLQLPPLAFNQAPLPGAFQAPRELVCPVEELGRPWSPPAPRPLWTARLSVDPRSLRPGGPEPLVNPLADLLLLLGLAGLASSTGGSVNFNPWPWPDRTPTWAAPLAAPFTPSQFRAKPGF
ncbi:hypothetical protein [Geothrix fuzhouensis]|uniref:hypothetical protein n=1 Tax=Geothrix fuzhouensis TaxID=2966451 RepID=UPI002147B6B9|nr:hypothetical protein [Geothrix fuzhouensis]